MIITHQRDKLINAIIYFCKNTDQCGKTKLFKLLYFLDFEHFKETGRSVTGLDYSAYQLGPVPESLNTEIDFPESDFEEKIEIKNIKTKNKKREMFIPKPKVEFDSSHFTKREMRLLKDLAEKFKFHTVEKIVEETHKEDGPWHRVYEVEKKPKQKIPYEYIFDNDEIPEDKKEKISDYKDMLRNYS